MSLDVTTSRNDYVGDGLVSEFEYTFKIFDKSHITVITKSLVSVETVLELDIDYTVAGVGEKDGGAITLTAGALTEDFALVILLTPPLTQPTDIKNQREFYPHIHENVFDRLTMISRRLQDQIERSLKLPRTTNPATFDMTLPTVLGADRTLVIGADGLSVVLGPTPAELSSAGVAASNAEDSALAAAASALAAAASATAALASANAASASADAAAASAAILENTQYINETSFTIANNQSSAADVTGLLFDKTQVGSAIITYWVKRYTTGAGATNLTEAGTMIATYDLATETWSLTPVGAGPNDSGVTFTITSTGQVQYTSTDITGTANTSKMKFKATSMGI